MFDKVQHPFWFFKNLDTLEINGNFIDSIKDIYKQPIGNIMLKFESFLDPHSGDQKITNSAHIANIVTKKLEYICVCIYIHIYIHTRKHIHMFKL